MIGNRMISHICCPQCGHPVEENARKCSNCGVDLAIAAVLAEREILPVRFTDALPVTPEILVPRLGEHLLETGKLGAAMTLETMLLTESWAKGQSNMRTLVFRE